MMGTSFVRTNTQCSFEFVLAFFTFKVFADKSKTLQWWHVLHRWRVILFSTSPNFFHKPLLCLFSQERLFPGSKSLVVPRESPEKRYLLFQNLHATIDSFDCSSIYLLLHLFSPFWNASSSTAFDKLTDSRKLFLWWGKSFHFLICLIFNEFQ